MTPAIAIAFIVAGVLLVLSQALYAAHWRVRCALLATDAAIAFGGVSGFCRGVRRARIYQIAAIVCLGLGVGAIVGALLSLAAQGARP